MIDKLFSRIDGFRCVRPRRQPGRAPDAVHARQDRRIRSGLPQVQPGT